MVDIPAFPSRAYGGDDDLILLEQFLLDVAGTRPPHVYWHIGTLFWSMFYGLKYDPYRDVRIWEDEAGSIQGFAWFDEPDSIDLQVHPRYRGTGVLETPMLAWAANHILALDPSAEHLWTSAIPTDSEYIDYLTAHGFEREAPASAKLWRQLDSAVPEPRLPTGWTVRHAGDEAEWPARVDAHREVWEPSSHTLEAYRRLRAAPGYDPELDIVAVAPDGSIASYCIFWHDTVNQIGLLEPVGTRTAYRRQGLSTAVLYEGLRRLRDRGARTAWVSTGAQSDHAIALYQSVGFRLLCTDHRYGKRLK